MKKQKTQNFYVYVRGIFNLWQLMYITDNIDKANKFKSNYPVAKVLKNRMRA